MSSIEGAKNLSVKNLSIRTKMWSLMTLLFCFSSVYCQNDVFEIGFGIADITGPAAEINMMGYAKTEQNTEGIHTRLYSRAAIIVDPSTKERVVFVSAELCSLTDIAKILVIERLDQIYDKGLYRHENVMLTASHTHSGPGGYFQYLLYLITSEGFQDQSLMAIVDGIVLSIKRAHDRLQLGKILYSEGELLKANINRSPTAYENNPKSEKDKYKYKTEKLMQILKFVDADDKPLGVIDWFAVHGTSMNNSNTLISSDNKGYASVKFEKEFITDSHELKDRSFVAIFAQANEGDSSPNTNGARCKKTGLPCDLYTSTCPKKDVCVATGPGKDMFESTKIIGEMQYQKARELFDSASEPVTGSIAYIHQNINMTNRMFEFENGTVSETCTAALGYSFAAGTTDGEGAAFFEQGTTTGEESRLWTQIRNFIAPMTQKQVDCHKPKPVLIPVGQMKFPYEWSAEIVPTQIMEIGNIVIIGVPAELTTMAGRRLKADIEKIYTENGRDVHVVISGLANSYTNYVTTSEEYQIQRYEGGSTLFGPRTLEAYQAQYRYLAKNLIQRQKIPNGPRIANLLSKQLNVKPGVIFDGSIGKRFGKKIRDAKSEYHKGDTVQVKFIGANPRNNLHLEGTFLQVLRRTNTTWTVHATDADWSTKFIWERLNVILANSQVTIVWNIPEDTPSGIYCIRYFGDAKSLLGGIHSFGGRSQPFHVI